MLEFWFVYNSDKKFWLCRTTLVIIAFPVAPKFRRLLFLFMGHFTTNLDVKVHAMRGLQIVHGPPISCRLSETATNMCINREVSLLFLLFSRLQRCLLSKIQIIELWTTGIDHKSEREDVWCVIRFQFMNNCTLYLVQLTCKLNHSNLKI